MSERRRTTDSEPPRGPGAFPEQSRYYARCVVCGRGYYQPEAVGKCVGGQAIGEGCGALTLFKPRPLVFRDKLGGRDVPGIVVGKSILGRKAELESLGWTFDEGPSFTPTGPVWWGWERSSRALWMHVPEHAA